MFLKSTENGSTLLAMPLAIPMYSFACPDCGTRTNLTTATDRPATLLCYHCERLFTPDEIERSCLQCRFMEKPAAYKSRCVHPSFSISRNLIDRERPFTDCPVWENRAAIVRLAEIKTVQ